MDGSHYHFDSQIPQIHRKIYLAVIQSGSIYSPEYFCENKSSILARQTL